MSPSGSSASSPEVGQRLLESASVSCKDHVYLYIPDPSIDYADSGMIQTYVSVGLPSHHVHRCSGRRGLAKHMHEEEIRLSDIHVRLTISMHQL